MNFSSDRLHNSQAPLPSSSSTISSQYARRHEEGRISLSGCSAVPANNRSTRTALSLGLEAGIESLKINANSRGSKMTPTSTCTANTVVTKKDEGSTAAVVIIGDFSLTPKEVHETRRPVCYSPTASTATTLPTCSNRSTQNYSQTRTTGSKRVRFCDTIAMREFHTLRHQYKYFFDEEDLELFGRDMKNTIKKVRKGNSSELDPDQHTLRGLEQFISKKIFKEVHTEKKRTIRLVLRAQSSGLTADEIAEICSQTTRGALARARHRGATYQADSFLYYESVT